MANVSVAQYIGKLLIESFDCVGDFLVLLLKCREKALYIRGKSESGFHYNLGQFEDVGAGLELFQRVKNLPAKALIFFKFGDDCMNERRLGLITTLVPPRVKPDRLNAAAACLSCEAMLQHAHQTRFTTAPRAEDYKGQRSQTSLSTNIRQHFNISAESEEIMERFFVRPHRVALTLIYPCNFAPLEAQRQAGFSSWAR